VDGHMPQAVKCPACGANGTAQANAAIRESLGTAAPPVETPPPTPVAKPGALRLNVHHPAETPASHAAPVSATNRPYPGAVPVGDASSVWKERGKKAVQLAWKGVLLLLCAIAMLAGFGGKKGKRLRLLTRITSSVIRANASTDELEE